MTEFKSTEIYNYVIIELIEWYAMIYRVPQPFVLDCILGLTIEGYLFDSNAFKSALISKCVALENELHGLKEKPF